MIKSKRRVAPASVNGKTSLGYAERTDAIAHFSKRRRKAFAFKVYKRDDIRQTLQSMFSNKCAYCETRFPALHPVEIEHYRPKSEVRRGTGVVKPGYYWLAADWTNLLPSCINCNRESRQEVHEGGRWSKVVCGKSTAFPLANRRAPRVRPGCERYERPLLLDPCVDDPERFLEFDEKGIVRPKPRVHAQTREKAIATIRTVALLRRGLVDERAARATLIMGRIMHVKRLLEASNAKRVHSGVLDALDADVRELKNACADAAEYSALARQLVARHLSPSLFRKAERRARRKRSARRTSP